MAEETGPLGFPKGPIRKVLGKDLFKSREFNRPLFGFLAETPTEIRSFRRATASALISTVLLGAYLGIILERVPQTG